MTSKAVRNKPRELSAHPQPNARHSRRPRYNLIQLFWMHKGSLFPQEEMRGCQLTEYKGCTARSFHSPLCVIHGWPAARRGPQLQSDKPHVGLILFLRVQKILCLLLTYDKQLPNFLFSPVTEKTNFLLIKTKTVVVSQYIKISLKIIERDRLLLNIILIKILNVFGQDVFQDNLYMLRVVTEWR